MVSLKGLYLALYSFNQYRYQYQSEIWLFVDDNTILVTKS